ncbi:MAG: asparagine synthase C-terminal domain-containing protein [Candidatus Bathyarchaeia archaeon]
MRVLTRKDVNKKNMWRYIIYGWLPIPESIIPPERPYYLWNKLDIIPYDSAKDYMGRLLDEIREAIRRSLRGWEQLSRLGVWVSGGIDSSVLLYLASEILGSDKVKAYCLTFGERDESEYAKRIADWCNVKLVIKEMTFEDSVGLTEEAVQRMRAPIDSKVVLYISKLCRQDGTEKVFSALGLDELTGGYPQHVKANDKIFSRVESDLIWRCQSNYVWLQLLQSRGYVDVRFPYLDSKLIAFCRGLPRSHKCSGMETKVRIREELRTKALIPEENIEAGKIVGTKGGFIPILHDWFKHGYADWCDENIPPEAFGFIDRLITRFVLEKGNTIEGKLQRRLRLATANIFYKLLDDGRFILENGG